MPIACHPPTTPAASHQQYQPSAIACTPPQPHNTPHITHRTALHTVPPLTAQRRHWTVASPVNITLGDVIGVALGWGHGLVVTKKGRVYGWGRNDFGQLGGAPRVPGSMDRLSTPRPVFLSVPMVAVSAGAHHSVALSADGSVYAWGDNSWGQLGTGESAAVGNLLTGMHHPLASRSRCVSFHPLALHGRCVPCYSLSLYGCVSFHPLSLHGSRGYAGSASLHLHSTARVAPNASWG